MFELNLQNKKLTAEALLHESIFDLVWTKQEVQVIRLCHLWLTGCNEFEFRTSGSTGIPKTITLSREQLKASAAATIAVLGLNASDHALLCLPAETIAGSMMAVRAMLLNIPLTVVEPSVDVLSRMDAQHPFTFSAFIPAQLYNVKNQTAVFNKFKHVLVGGAGISQEMEDVLRGMKPRIYHTYGMTETASHIAWRELHTHIRFMPLPGIELKTDGRGCLCIKGDVTQQQWIVTNDVVELTTNGFTVKGRADYAINTGGVKVHPEEVEKLLAACEPLHNKHFFITGLPHPQWGQEVVLILEGQKPLTENEWEMLCMRVSEIAGKYAAPKRCILIHSFVMSTSGKINRPATINSLNV